MSTDLSNLNQQDVFDIRDVIERYEELTDDEDRDEAEFQMLGEFLDEVRGCGGDEQWQGDWYPVTFVRESYFVRYAEELAEEIGAIDRNARWPANCIDWEQAARELRFDYSCVSIGGVDYWYR
jgi:antirestriction protein